MPVYTRNSTLVKNIAMKRVSYIFIILMLTFACNAQQPSESVSKFAFDLYKYTANNPNENIVFAPFSLAPAFGMVGIGAKAETAKQLSQVFHAPMEQPSFHRGMGKLQNRIQKDAQNGVNICITNRIWMEETFKVNCKYKRSLQKSYRAKVALTSFISEPEPSRIKINKAIEADTKNYIKDLLPGGSVTDLTRLVLTNAIYFKGEWEKGFNPKRTSQRGFRLSSGKNIECPTMFVEDSMRYFTSDSHDAIELNYKGKKIAMLILLPNERMPMAEFEKELNIDIYNRTLANLKTKKVAVLLPKFKIETGLSLKNTLSEMGMPIAFSDAADLSGITGKTDLKISDAFHKAYIEVTEEGTTAAAATAVVVAIKSIARKTEFIANRPFIFILKHNGSNTILFMGKVENPNK